MITVARLDLTVVGCTDETCTIAAIYGGANVLVMTCSRQVAENLSSQINEALYIDRSKGVP